MSNLHIIIAGGGIGGLCLAQSLHKAGISCAVYERDLEMGISGYRLHMNADGGNALRFALPDHLYELYVQTSRRTPRREMAILLDKNGIELGVRPHIGPANDPVLPHTAVNRKTLRQILLIGIEHLVHFGQKVTGYTQSDSGVQVQLQDGTIVNGDLLIGADGINSVIRKQLLPDIDVIDTGTRALYSKLKLNEKLATSLPDVFFDGLTSASDDAGTYMAICPYQPRRAVTEAVAELAPGAAIEHVDDYIMVSLSIGPDAGISDDVLRQSAPQQLHDIMKKLTSDWSGDLRKLVAHIDPDTIFPQTIRLLDPAEPWTTSRVTLLGDAIHAMPPSYGAGANLALKDAHQLAQQMIAMNDRPADWAEYVHAYEQQMRSYSYPILEMSSNKQTARTFTLMNK
ncbi:FAD-dependent oxidoreductase [Paenibacillus sp. WLX2291]|uniref:FAD-dependent oxidoreductase n=1 Tax=Paenibacillus sp. WLX2291 TaxID=3296934 RepID=UPI003984356D